MDIFRVGTQIQQTVKSMGRLRVIANVMLKFGFSELLQRMKLGRFNFLEKKESKKIAESMTLPQRVRSCFEELGPTLIKLGQLLSIRPDLVPPEFVEEFKKLQDSAAPVPIADIKKVLQESLGDSAEHLFLQFEETPIASASIAQVHGALLHDATEVVVKIQKPGIDKIIDTDLAILRQLAQLLERYVPESRVINPTGIVKEFARNLNQELNFSVESNNIRKIAQNFKADERVIIPKVYTHFSTNKVLTMERLHGIPFRDKGGLLGAGVNIPQVCGLAGQVFFKMMFIHGVFHSDPHSSNLFVIDTTKLGLLDFGSVGRLSQRTRDSLANIFLGLASEDYEMVVNEYVELGTVIGKVDVASFTRECREIIEPNFGIPLKDVNIGVLIRDLTVAASRNNIRVSQDLMLLTRALLVLDGVVRYLDPEFDLFSAMGEFVRELIKSRYSPQRLAKDLLWILQDASQLLRVLPRQLKQVLSRLSSDELGFKIEINNLEKLNLHTIRSRHFLAFSIMISAVIISSTLLVVYNVGGTVLGLSTLGVFGYIFGGSLFLLSLLLFIRR